MRPGGARRALRPVAAGLTGAVVAGALAGAGLAVTAGASSRWDLGPGVTDHGPVPYDPVPQSGPGAVATPVADPGPSQRPLWTEVAEAPVAEPVAVSLPEQGIRSTLDPLHLEPDGELQAPPRWDVAGWYVGSPRPGERGPSVIAGHVDGSDGPAVFWRLGQVRAGDPVEVLRADGTTAVFAVTRTLVVPKSGFPTSEVYGPTPGAELRLITCGGPFDRRSGHYVDNLIVFATEVLP